ncbi:MAG: hypothetical protein IIT88_00905 [Acetobacter sp.]|nr:hypothetical protein [Acetobacter sp.]
MAVVDSTTRVLILVQGAEAEALFRNFVDAVCPGEGVVVRCSLTYALEYLKKNEVPPYLIIDIAGATDPIATVREIKETVPPKIVVMAVGDREDINFYRTMTHALGVAEYLYRPLVESLVIRIFGNIILHGQESGRDSAASGGSVVLLTGVRDGIGTSTLITNLAWYLAKVLKRHTLLLDFNLQASKLGILLNVEETVTGFQTLLATPERIDSVLVQSSLQDIDERLSLLYSFGSIMEKPVITPEAVNVLLSQVCSQFHFVLVKSNWYDGRVYNTLLNEAQRLIFVMDPTLVSMRDTLRIVATLQKDVLLRKPFFVLNNFGRPGTLSMNEVRSSLDTKPDVVIPYLPKECGEAEITGKPLVSNNAKYRAAIMQIAQSGLLMQAAGRKIADHSSTSSLGSLFSFLRKN